VRITAHACASVQTFTYRIAAPDSPFYFVRLCFVPRALRTAASSFNLRIRSRAACALARIVAIVRCDCRDGFFFGMIASLASSVDHSAGMRLRNSRGLCGRHKG